MIEGAQSSVYGAYANSGVVNFVTRTAADSPYLDVLAEGGTYQEHRFALGGAGTLAGFGVAAFVSQLGDNGPVPNSDYRNDNVSLHVTRSFGRQSLSFGGRLQCQRRGRSRRLRFRSRARLSGARHDQPRQEQFLRLLPASPDRYLAALPAGDVRQLLSGKQRLHQSVRIQLREGPARPVRDAQHRERRRPGIRRRFGVSLTREEVKNTYINDDNFNPFPIRRDDAGIYWENRFQAGSRLFFNAGVRGEIIGTPYIPENVSDGRPAFPANTVTKINPKLAATYVWRAGTRLHTSFGTGIRPPAGLELAFTDNPALKPERTASFDFGVEQRLWGGRLSLDGTYFYNRFYDLIVSLGGNLAVLSAYQTANLSNARAQGAEFSGRLRPARWMSLAASYTYLDSAVLSLNGSSGLAPIPFTVGQELIRRPANSGSFVSTFARGRVTANVTGYLRGSDLDVDPTYGATAGLFADKGFVDLGINLNIRLADGVTAYGNLRNALNQSYEEVLGFPAPKLNFVAGLKWTLAKGKR